MDDPNSRTLIQLHHTCYVCNANLSRAQRLNSHLASVHDIHVPNRRPGTKRGYSVKYRQTGSLILPRNEPHEAQVCIRHACGSCFEHFATIDELAKHTIFVHIGRGWPFLSFMFQPRAPILPALPEFEPIDSIVIQQSDYDDQSKAGSTYDDDDDDDETGSLYYEDNDDRRSETESLENVSIAEDHMDTNGSTMPVSDQDEDVDYHSEASFAPPPGNNTSNRDAKGKAVDISSALEDVIVQMRKLLSQL